MTPFILIVEDDERMASLLSTKLRALGYDTAIAVDAIQAGTRIKERMPSLILLDFMIPAGTGAKVLERFNFTTSHQVPVIVMSGSKREIVEQAFPKSPYVVFHPKPVDFPLLEKQIRAFTRPKDEDDDDDRSKRNILDLDAG